jgi:hypothetical protein
MTVEGKWTSEKSRPVKRICIIFPDGSISIMPNGEGETAARIQAYRRNLEV